MKKEKMRPTSQNQTTCPTEGVDFDCPTDRIVAQWKAVRPDLDPSPMAVCGDVWHAGDVLKKGVLDNIAEYKLDFPQFDVLMTLRRQEGGKTLSPSELAKEMMLSTSAMTNRLDRLEKRKFVERLTDPNDRRSQQIALTKEGFDVIDHIVVSHLEVEESMLSALNSKERDQLRTLLAKIINT